MAEAGTMLLEEHERYLDSKPLLRGWFHAAAALAALAFTVVICWRSWSNLPRFIALAIFGLSLIQLYTVSAVYHIGAWPAHVHRRLRAVDHANIFVLIAATYTPLCCTILGGPARVTILAAVWTLAGLGVGGVVGRWWRSRWVGVALYLAMGWLGLLALPAFIHAAPAWGSWLLLLGGLFYTVGALIYARRWPNPFPRVLGFHEIFHLCVIGGSGSFAAAIWLWVLPAAHP